MFQYQITWLFLCYSVERDQEIVIVIDTRGVQVPLKCGRSLQKCNSSEVINWVFFYSEGFSVHILISGVAVHAVI
jgi:hypothetical protein